VNDSAADRRGLVDRELLRPVGLAFATVAVLLIVTNLTALQQARFPDPDDILRMIQVRDLLAGQGWFDLAQHRVDAPHGGVPMHWSRLVDIPLAATILVLAPFLGQANAEVAAIVLVPLLTMGLALLLAGRIAWRYLRGDAVLFACLALAMSVPVVHQLRPLRVDHHGWQIVLALVAANGLTARNPRLGGWIIGLALAAWLTISIEALPLAAVFAGVLVLRWLRDGTRTWLLHTMLALASGSALFYLATRGLADLANHCDAVSPVHLAIFGWGALGIAALAFAGRRALAIELGGFAVVGGGALAILYSAAPACTGGGFSELDPLVRAFWYENVAEGLPVWRQKPADILQLLIPAGIALQAAVRLGRRGSEAERPFWTDYAVLLAGAIAISLLVARAGAVAAALAAAPLGWQIAEWYRAAKRLERPGRRAALLAAMALALVPAMPFTLFKLVAPARAAGIAPAAHASSCDIRKWGPQLRRLGSAEVLAPLDIGPGLLYESRLEVFATGHHRGNLAMRETITLFLGSSESARQALLARGTDHVAVCTDLSEPAGYARVAPEGFAAQLIDGKAPGWLEPVIAPKGSSFRLWRVTR
jgi:hypothetical protein